MSTVPELTTSYQKTHKSYVMSAALLASWQLVGITLDTKEKWGITLKSPNAIPLILIALVIYFGYKLVIEWLQCDSDRRQHPAARIDYRVAHGLAIAALFVTYIQSLLQKQVIDLIKQHTTPVDSVLIISSFLMWYFISIVVVRFKTAQKISWSFGFLIIAILTLVAITSAVLAFRSSVWYKPLLLILSSFIVAQLIRSWTDRVKEARLAEAQYIKAAAAKP